MQATFADIILPSEKRRTIAFNIILLVSASLLIAVCAQISVNLPFGPVPITGQTFGVLLIGALLGANRGALAVLLYLFEGAIGLPFFAGAAAGMVHIVGPTGGYLSGFVLAAWVVGFLAEKGWDRRPVLMALAMAIGTGLIFTSGLLWLSLFVPPQSLLALGLLPFLPGAVLKIALASALLPAAWKLSEKKETRF